MQKVLLASAALASLVIAATSVKAADIDINVGTAGIGIVQNGVSNALSDLKSTATIDQVIGMNALKGEKTDDVNVGVLVLAALQNAKATATVPAGAPMTAKSVAEIVQVAGLDDIDLDKVKAGANINALTIVAGVVQDATTKAIGTAAATAEISQLAAVQTISVNVD